MHGAREELSLLLESSTEPTIHSTLDYFLRLLYERLETSPKRHVAACAMYNTFVDTFRKKLLMLFERCGAIPHVGCDGYVGWEEDRF